MVASQLRASDTIRISTLSCAEHAFTSAEPSGREQAQIQRQRLGASRSDVLIVLSAVIGTQVEEMLRDVEDRLLPLSQSRDPDGDRTIDGESCAAIALGNRKH